MNQLALNPKPLNPSETLGPPPRQSSMKEVGVEAPHLAVKISVWGFKVQGLG